MSSSESDTALPPSAQPRDTLASLKELYLTPDELELEDSQLSYSAHETTSDASNNALSNFEGKGNAVELQDQRSESDPPDPGRRNRFRGPSSTWRSWTAAERDIARSLDQLKSQDLSTHLYNAFALKARARKMRARQSGNSGAGPDGTWEPPKLWTAWPMRAEEVPRESNALINRWAGIDALVSRPHLVLDSRKVLEESLLATTARQARERFFVRIKGDESDDLSDDRGLSDSPSLEPGSTGSKKRRRLSGATTDDSHHSSVDLLSDYTTKLTDEDSEARTSKIRGFEHNGYGSSGPDVGAEMEVDAVDDAERQERAVESDVDSNLSEASEYQAVPLADDDMAIRMAMPPIRHLISNIETLLHGLHSARQLRPRGKRRPALSHENKGTSKASSRSHSRSRRKLQAKTFSGRRRSKLAHSVPDSSDSEYQVSDEASSEPDQLPAPKQHQKRQHSRYRKPGTNAGPIRGLWDWSEILGLAAIQGWDQHVIERARVRCSALFKERMEFTSIELGGDGKSGETSQGKRVRSEDEMEGGVHLDGFLRPIKRRRGWRGKNKEKGNWRSRQNSRHRKAGSESESEEASTQDSRDSGGGE